MTQNDNNGFGQVDWKRQNEGNRYMIDQFHANKGDVAELMGGTPLLLLETTGAKSGQLRTNPLVYYSENGRLFIFATKAGAPTNPDWYYNILAHPEVTVELGTEKFPATGVVLGEEERARIYAKLAALSERFAEYERTTTRKIPVIELIRK
ncbi:MAG TPA: nitroreductase family deazaflavin-dependent oxidoreductase [Ktedonobacteraceae bacterium]|nr:nitroreductase family deazaflavin-dependent oxidoreductase [Ktedonobacteraceae bacterium]